MLLHASRPTNALTMGEPASTELRSDPNRSPSPPTRRRSPTLGPTFTDKLRDRLSMISIALQESDSGVKERRAKTQPVRKGRKGGIWNSVADLLGTASAPRSRKPSSEELPMPRDRGRRTTLRRASSADSFDVSPRDAQPDCTPSHSVMAQLARLDVAARGQLVKEDSPPLLTGPNGTCRSRSSPTFRKQSPFNDMYGNDADPDAVLRLLRPTPSHLRSPSRQESPDDGTPAVWPAWPAAWPTESDGHLPGMGLFSYHGAASADSVSQLEEDDYTPDTVLASFSSGSGSSGGSRPAVKSRVASALEH